MRSDRLDQRMLDAIRAYIAANGYPPSLRDLMALCNYATPSAVQYRLGRLEAAGRIARTPGVSRGIRVVEG